MVKSSEARAHIVSVDPSPALSLPGVISFVGADDIPKGGVNEVYGAPVFAKDQVVYVGQPLGLIVADNQKLAERAAAAVVVKYNKSKQTKPVITLQDAIDADSFYDLDTQLSVGDVESALRSSKHTLTGVR